MSQDAKDDPLGLDAVDREIRMEKLRNDIEKVTGSEMIEGKLEDVPPELEESFLEHVLAMEEHGFVRPLDALKNDGFKLPSPDELDDEALSTRLHALIHELARRRLFLYSTDHLSDRQLYTWLLTEGLSEEMMGFGLPYGNCHLDVIGSGSDDDIEIQMRYYANDEDRANWSRDFPDFEMPPREPRPYDRDRYLPQATR